MLVEYSSMFKGFEFIAKGQGKNNNNKYSVIVGKNGTGKSRLLKSIINKTLQMKGLDYRFEREDRTTIEQTVGYLNFEALPNKIIAVSTSPFDRFPIPKRNEYVITSNDYIYLGLRDIISSNLSLGYMTKIINSLIVSIIRGPEKSISIAQVMNYLGYSDVISVRFQLSPTITKMESIINGLNPEMDFENYLNLSSSRNINKYFYLNKHGGIDTDKIHQTFDIFNKISSYTRKPRLNLYIDRSGVLIAEDVFLTEKDFVFLISTGIAKLRDVSLQKIETGHQFKISEASSGEQSIVMGFLGIASKIEDNSLICIDEPEVCLHPEWQEKYIELLISAFAFYKNCHFIIATHSPQIVSNLEDDNCFVTSMDDGVAINSFELNNKSIDFQLANTFQSPGHKNEYLSRELISFLTMFGNGQKISLKQVERIKKLLLLENIIEDEDPVKKLMGMVKEIIGEYL
ncbi:AAA family ATPase [Aliivibrio fischeri]|uniref:AAA family ATPase n=1 Tax=Aliivibrio fischeri TaxID=668 RepID=UPI0012DA18FA|nr:AAA family ATPase [Aliivibrio fischeri]MUJ39723.1 AAA family ATPase [Aliivibrio fischeri]